MVPGGKFEASVLRGSDFSHADLTGSSFKASDVADANFDSANLTDANMPVVELARASFRGSILARTVASFPHRWNRSLGITPAASRPQLSVAAMLRPRAASFCFTAR